MGILLSCRSDKRLSGLVIPLFLLVAMLNRFSFLPFGGLFICLIAWLDAARANRLPVLLERALQWGALGAGALLNLNVAPTSLGVWTILPVLLGVSAVTLFGSIVLDLLALSSRVRRVLHALPAWLPSLGAVLAFIGLLGVSLRQITTPEGPDSDNLFMLLAYTGIVPFLLAGAGGWLFFCRDGRCLSLAHRTFWFFVLCVFGLMLYSKNIYDWYPWATRRYFPWTTPLLACLAGYAIARLWEWCRGRAKWLPVALVVLAIVPDYEQIYTAWNNTEYGGIAEALRDVAAEVGPKDIVVADHPWWGTPLSFVHGKQVLDGKGLWSDEAGGRIQTGMAALRRLVGEGHHVRFLTSSPEGISIYRPPPPVSLDWSATPIDIHQIKHHRTQTAFQLQTRRVDFRLYTLVPPAPSAKRQ